MANLIGALRVSLSADTAQFAAGMTRAQRQAAKSAGAINKSLGTVKAGLSGFAAAFSIGLMTNVIKGSLDYAASLGEVAAQLGVTTTQLQNFRAAAGQMGVTAEEADKGIGKLSLSLEKARAGSDTTIKAFGAVGISIDDIRKKNAYEIFAQMSDAMNKTGGPSKNVAAGFALMGKTFQKFIPLAEGGSKGLNELARANEELGGVLSDEQIQNADKTADKLDQLSLVLRAQLAGTVSQNADAILGFAGALTKLAGAVLKFLNSNPQLALGIMGGMAGSRFGVAGVALGALGGAAAGQGMATAADDGNSDLAYRAKRLREARAEYSIRKKAAISGGRTLIRVRRNSNSSSGATLASARDELVRQIRLTKKARTTANKPGAVVGTDPTSQFLAPSGGGGGGKKPGGGKKDNSARDAERARIDALRDAYRFAEDERRADMDILRAKESLSTDYTERSALNIQMLDLERASFVAEQANSVALGDITAPQAAILQAKYDERDTLERKKVLQDEELERQRIFNSLEQTDFTLRREMLEQQAGLAETASERRAVELQILDLALQEARERQARLERESTDWAEIETGRRELAGLEARQGGAREGVMRGTRGPLEEYLASLPNSAAKANEALEQVAVGGLQSIQDGILGVIDGSQKMGEAFKNIANSIIQDLIRIALQKAIVGALGKAIGSIGGIKGAAPAANPYANLSGNLTSSIPGYATGGGFTILGRKGRDKNIMSLNGLPIAKVSHGERVNVSNDNANAAGGGGGGRIEVIPSPYFNVVVDGRAANVAAPMASRAAMVGAAGGQQSMQRQQRRAIP